MHNIYIFTALILLACGCAAPVLYNSAGKGDVAKVRSLLAAGADPNEHSALYLNETALHMAVLKSRLDVARLLIEHGADINAEASVFGGIGRRKHFGTPLHYAACVGQAAMVQLLLESGADPDLGPGICSGSNESVDKDNGTPLQLAEKHGHTIVASLIKAAISSKLGLTAGGAKNMDEYGPIVGALLKGYKGENKTIAVAGFSYTDGHASSDGDVVAARITTELVKLKKLTVVERKEIQKMLAELKLQNAGVIDPDSAKKLGKMLGADLLVVGTMAELPGNILELNVRLASVESGTAISAVSGQVKKNWLK